MPFGKKYGSKSDGKGYGSSGHPSRTKAPGNPGGGKKQVGEAPKGRPSFHNNVRRENEARNRQGKDTSWGERPSYSERRPGVQNEKGQGSGRPSFRHDARPANEMVHPVNEGRSGRKKESWEKQPPYNERHSGAPNATDRENGRPTFPNNARPSNGVARPANETGSAAKKGSWEERPAYGERRLIDSNASGTKWVAKSANPNRVSNHRAPDENADLPPENLLVGRNPIREAIKSGRDIEKLMVAKGDLSGSAREIIALARDASIVVQTVDRAHLNELAPNHQGMIAIASAFRYASIEDIFDRAAQKNEAPLIVVLDGITDPHNVGAMIRSAECAGAHGLVIPNRRAAGLTPAAVKASAGAVEHLPVARVTNISKFLETLKARGLWITAADPSGEPYASADLTGPLALVVGSEGDGISRLVLSGCDRRVALPMFGKIDSLNASVACGILLYEIRRQRG